VIKVTKFSSEKNFQVGGSPLPVGQTPGPSHFGETPLSLEGGDFTVALANLTILQIINNKRPE